MARRRISTLCLVAAVVAASAFSATSATLTSLPSKAGPVIVVLNGEIVPGDAGRLQQIIKTANDSRKLVGWIRLNSPGGNLLESIKLADAIRFGKIASIVPKGTICTSACFIVFAAGAEKFASYSASIGVHGASDANGEESVGSSAATVGMAKIIKELGVPADIIGRMVVTPPDQMVWLTPNNLRAMGTTLTGKPVQTPTVNAPSQLPPAQPSMQAHAPTKWENVMKGAIDVSKRQHNGKPLVTRMCFPKTKTCAMGIFFTRKDGLESLITTTEDSNGKIFKREICEVNRYGDVYSCVDFDRGTAHRGMKDANGNWVNIEDQ